jgi:hypothetical protein
LAILTCGSFLPAQVGVTTLTPSSSFKVNEASALSGVKLREMRSGNNELWMLVQSEAGDFAMIRSGPTGASQGRIGLPAGVRVTGLAATGTGFAAVWFRNQRPFLAQHERGGRLASEIPLGCTMADALLSMEGSVGIVCPDGQITRYSTVGRIGSQTSWARPGSLSESLRGNRLAVVDQATGHVLLNDITSGGITSVSGEVPELVEARKQNAAVNAAMKTGALQKQLMIMDTATDSVDLYMLVWPYPAQSGPSVVRLSAEGKLVARYKCSTPGGEMLTFHKIEVQNGFLLLGSVSGTIYRYKI